MSDLRIHDEPELRRPLVIAGFAGWNDAGEAATSAVRFIRRRWRATPFADIDPEEFYDFTQARPHVRLEKGERVLEWPANEFSAHRLEKADRDVILLSGIEPHVHWRRFVENIVGVCQQYEVSGFVTLGGLLAEVSHASPVRVGGSATDADLARELGFDEPTTSGYQGPTGIVGVLSRQLREAGIETASLWANIPFYIQRSPNPKGALAILQRLNSAFSLDLSLHDLEVFAARFDAQVAADLEQNPEAAEYARRVADEEGETPSEMQVTEDGDDDLPDAESMVDELERFLRQQRDEQD
ncbi:MAG: PAC2 family protein [Chloroflexi bacterium]|nr:PAC2 family protein [Chloroflexota bacterium]MDA1146029.1 PAC2 family protein [Chloroflexota bacterium]